jgi:hypothetical protein
MGRRYAGLRVALQLAAIAALAGGTALAAIPIRPRHGRPFDPVTGDWEAIANGFPASFALVYDPRNERKYGWPPYDLEDLAYVLPDTCPPNRYN